MTSLPIYSFRHNGTNRSVATWDHWTAVAARAHANGAFCYTSKVRFWPSMSPETPPKLEFQVGKLEEPGQPWVHNLIWLPHLSLSESSASRRISATWSFVSLKSRNDRVVQCLSKHLLFLCFHAQAITSCAAICGYELTVLTATNGTSILLLQLTNETLSTCASFLAPGSDFRGKWNTPLAKSVGTENFGAGQQKHQMTS